MKYTLYTYKDIFGFRKIEETCEIKPFIFQETLNALQINPNICLDITALVYYLLSSPQDRYVAYNNLKAMTDETIVIIDETVADKAISIFPFLFSKAIPYDEIEEIPEIPSEKGYFSWVRQPIYVYDNSSELDKIVEYASDNSIPLATFSQATGNARKEFETFNRAAELALIDVTSVSYAIDDNKNLIYLVESLLNVFQNIRVIVKTSQIDNILDYFPLYFEGQKSVYELLPDLGSAEEQS